MTTRIYHAYLAPENEHILIEATPAAWRWLLHNVAALYPVETEPEAFTDEDDTQEMPRAEVE